ncbi:MAG: dihydrolipoamide acetyltransferase family protein [Arthrobacter sp.]|uniref:dihydrolipoamide acetyltransferase family protein n=1 Tax=Arthrobacter sp. TaxID=1667 RepID=UPI00347ABF4C
MSTFHLPDVGEGLTEADVVSWKVKPGDDVEVNQVFVEIETAKSLVELPSPFAGVVTELHAAEGETLAVGAPLFSVSEGTSAGGPAAPASTAASDAADAAAGGAAVAGDDDDVAPGPLVGSGPKADPVRRRSRQDRPSPQGSPSARQAAPASSAPAQSPAAAAGVPPAADHATPADSAPSRGIPPRPRVPAFIGRVLAKPPVRKIAKELGIDLREVPATGGHGEVTRGDLLSYQAQREAEQAAAPTFWAPREAPLDSRIEQVPVRGVRKATAKAMVDSAFSAPHVSIFVDVDASRTMEFVQRLKKSRDFEGIKVSPLLILAKAVVWAAARNPSVNASWVDTEHGAEIRVKHFMNLGIAAATPRGLLVPNIKEAQDLGLRELAVELNQLAATAREGKTRPEDMRDGTLTITNIGALGIDIGTPIINPGEVAIVAFGTIKLKPWVVAGEVVPRWITTLGGSFDHRVVDGDLSARFMADVAAIMEEPALLLE